MKRIFLAAAVFAGCSVASAQQPLDVPQAKCEPRPQLPAPALMADKMVRRTFDQDLNAYKACIKAYVDQREASMKAHQEAANAAINEYNATMKSLNDADAANRGQAAGGDKKY